MDEETAAEPKRPARTGRKRDHTRDADILAATVDVLAEVGYERMTMDMVAARAKAGKATVYRRWPSKPELVLQAVSRMKRDLVDLDRLPDTGTLRGDLVALIKPQSIEESDRKLRVMAGLSSMMSQHPRLAEAANAAVIEPWADAHRALISRAVERGEVPEADVETLSRVVASMAAFRTLIQHQPVDRTYIVSLIDGLLLPAIRGSGSTPAGQKVPGRAPTS